METNDLKEQIEPDIKLDIQRAEEWVAEWRELRLARAERFCRISNVHPNQACPGILKDFAEREVKDMNDVMNALAQALAEKGKANTALEQRVAQYEWQPIDTAPKDGTRIDVWEYCHNPVWRPDPNEHGLDNGMRYADVYWSQEQNDWVQMEAYLGEAHPISSPHYTISHWRPIPSIKELKGDI